MGFGIGVVCIVLAVALAGNWLYVPVEPTVTELEGKYAPVPHYPDDDPADRVFSSNLTYIPDKDMCYQEWNFVWLNVSTHTPDTEGVRVYVKNNSVHHVELRVHYMWMKTTDFETTDERVHIGFTDIYHTPYTTKPSYYYMMFKRALPIALLVIAGVSFIGYSYLHRRHD